jgi:hypothetical protein
LTLRARSTLIRACRLLGLLAIRFALVLRSIIGAPRVVAVGTSLPRCLVLLTRLLCAFLAVVALLVGLLGLMGVVTLRPALADRLALAAVVGSLGTPALTSARLIALRST